MSLEGMYAKEVMDLSDKKILKNMEGLDVGRTTVAFGMHLLAHRSNKRTNKWIIVCTVIITLATLLQLAKVFQWFGF
jgi:hypothetical protein